MKDIVIIGAGGFGHEVQWLIERINEQKKKESEPPEWNLLGYIDDGVKVGTKINDHTVLGNCDYLMNQITPLAVVCAIGTSKTRKKIIEKISSNNHLSFPNLIDPSVQMSNRIELGKGNIICAGSILTVNIKIANFCIINLGSTVGHDAALASFVTIYPSVNISGCVNVGECSELGTGVQVIQGKNVGSETIVGAGAVVVKDLPNECTAVGTPCKPIKFHKRKAILEMETTDIKMVSDHQAVISENTGGGYKQVTDISVSNHKKLLILGAGGHGKVVADIAAFVYDEVLFIDDNPDAAGFYGIPVVGDSSYAVFHKDEYDVFVAVGNSKTREKLNLQLKQNGVTLVSLVHPCACVASDIEIGNGTVIMAGAVINSGSKIGDGVIINTGATVDHDNYIEDYSHISVGTHLAGTVHIGKATWIGAGAVVRNNLSICDGCLVGAGAVVVKDIVEPGTYLGIPVIKKDKKQEGPKVSLYK